MARDQKPAAGDAATYDVVICFRNGRRETFSGVSPSRAQELERNFGTDPAVLWITANQA